MFGRGGAGGAHFRDEHQTGGGEAQRDDAHGLFAAAWERVGSADAAPHGPRYVRHQEHLEFPSVPPETRDYR